MNNKEKNRNEIINKVVQGILKIEQDAANQIEEVNKATMISRMSDFFEGVLAEYED